MASRVIPIAEAQHPASDLLEHEMYDTPEMDVLVLNYTLACPLRCDFCCYGCHPGRTEKMPLSNAKALVTQAASLANFSSVGLTGGEVFMYPEELIELAQHISTTRLKFTVATAGHWGADKAYARELSKQLVEFGLKRANISCDPSHSAHVAREHVIEAARALAEFNIPIYIVGTFSDTSQSLESYLPELKGIPNVMLRTKLIAQVGRAKKKKVQYLPEESAIIEKSCYRRRYHDLVVFWDGKVYPCCSTFNRSTKGIVIGNAFEEPLERIWRRLEFSSLFRLMKGPGYAKILEIISERDQELYGRLPPISEFPGACSYCNKLFSIAEIGDRIKKVFALYEVEAILESYDDLISLLGIENAAAIFQQNRTGAANGG